MYSIYNSARNVLSAQYWLSFIYYYKVKISKSSVQLLRSSTLLFEFSFSYYSPIKPSSLVVFLSNYLIQSFFAFLPSPLYLHESFSLFDYLSFNHSPKLSLKLTFDIKFFLTTSTPNVLPLQGTPKPKFVAIIGAQYILPVFFL